jgi:hypothetical protein
VIEILVSIVVKMRVAKAAKGAIVPGGSKEGGSFSYLSGNDSAKKIPLKGVAW